MVTFYPKFDLPYMHVLLITRSILALKAYTLKQIYHLCNDLNAQSGDYNFWVTPFTTRFTAYLVLFLVKL